MPEDIPSRKGRNGVAPPEAYILPDHLFAEKDEAVKDAEALGDWAGIYEILILAKGEEKFIRNC